MGCHHGYNNSLMKKTSADLVYLGDKDEKDDNNAEEKLIFQKL